MQNVTYSSLFLADGNTVVPWIIVAVVAILAIVASILCWVLSAKQLKSKYEKEQGTIEDQRNKMLDNVMKESRAMKKEALLEAKEQEVKLRGEFERESKEKRARQSRPRKTDP